MEHLALSPDSIVLAGVLNDILVYGFRTLFFLSAILLMVIVLLQEGKGGGLASALGGQGAETFGVATGGVNKVTLFLAGLFLLSGLAHALSFGQPIARSIPVKEGGSREIVLPGGTEGGDLEDGGGEKKPAEAPGGGEKKPADAPPEKAPADGEKK
ncbi:MAG: preprotein translocase subunit SecG [Planctomycetaceae bacterium]|nr:preprotein translocase subunit SecG [Planctomycetota bacterium]NUN53414.1 preprotein translocase subunit SecG [Planctomycetaceae bacterium]